MKFSALHRQALFLVSAAAVMLMASASANASILSVSPTGGSVGDNVISANCNGGTAANTPQPTVTGCLNGDHDSLVNFLSPASGENVKFEAGGQAVITAADGAMASLRVDPVSFTLNRLIVNIDANADGWAKFCDNTGCFGTLFEIDRNGSNFFDITFNPKADYMTVYTYLDQAGTQLAQLIANSKQWRLSAPEPFTMSLFGAGIAALVVMRRRKKAQLAQSRIA